MPNWIGADQGHAVSSRLLSSLASSGWPDPFGGFGLKEGAIDLLSAHRVRHELERILHEKHPLPTLQRAEEVGLLAAVNPALPLLHLNRLPQSWTAEPLTWLAALVWQLDPGTIASLSARLNPPSEWFRIFYDVFIFREQLPCLLAEGIAPSTVSSLLDRLSPHVLHAAVALENPVIGERIRRYQSEWRETTSSLRVSDLLDLGIPAGPAVGEALRALRNARLDGEVASQQDEELLAQRRVPEPEPHPDQIEHPGENKNGTGPMGL